MKILLIVPPTLDAAYGKYKAAAKMAAQPQMPLGICYIAAVLEKNHEVKIIDSDVELLTISGILSVIEKFKPNIVGVTGTTPIYPIAKDVLKAIKNKFSNIITIIGGFHLTALPIETMKECIWADYGVYGEGEETMVELINAIKNKKSINSIKGILWRKNNKIIMNKPRPLIRDIDNLPFPAIHLLKYQKYLWSVPGKKFLPVAAITTQRGCPYNCIFCGVKTMFNGVRFRSLNKIMAEIEHIVRDLKINHILFQDDTLTLNKDKVIKMCKEIEKRNLKFTWEGYTRANTVTKNLLKLMKKTGLVRLSFGVESGDQYILDAAKKESRLEDYKKVYEWCHELDIETRCSLMVGLPFETKKTIKKTIKFANSLKCYQAYINVTTPFPGCELYNLAKKNYGGVRLLTEDWREYRRYGNAVIEVNDLTRKDLIKAQKEAYRKFYLRPKIILYNLKRAGFKAAIKNSMAFFKSVLLQ